MVAANLSYTVQVADFCTGLVRNYLLSDKSTIDRIFTTNIQIYQGVFFPIRVNG